MQPVNAELPLAIQIPLVGWKYCECGDVTGQQSHAFAPGVWVCNIPVFGLEQTPPLHRASVVYDARPSTFLYAPSFHACGRDLANV